MCLNGLPTQRTPKSTAKRLTLTYIHWDANDIIPVGRFLIVWLTILFFSGQKSTNKSPEHTCELGTTEHTPHSNKTLFQFGKKQLSLEKKLKSKNTALVFRRWHFSITFVYLIVHGFLKQVQQRKQELSFKRKRVWTITKRSSVN